MAEIDYKAILDKAWQQHLAPREPKAPTVASLFAGCGGSSLGYSMAGYRELLAVDFDEKCAETFRVNFFDVPFLVADVRELTAERLMTEAGLAGPRELDVLDGSPPCQGFSTAGKRDLWDPRNELYREFARLLEEVQPRAFVMENVSGMVKGKMKLAFADCTRALKATGYQVSCRLLNAKYFWVPQSRERLIWIGVRDDLKIKSSHPVAESESLCALCATMRINDIVKNPYGMRKFNLAQRTLKHHRPAPTLTKSEVIGSDLPFAGDERIGAERAAIIGSFPSQFRFSGDWRDKVFEIANSVPPLMMRSIALHIKKLLADA